MATTRPLQPPPPSSNATRSPPPPTAATAASQISNLSSVRRNLFHHSLSRRQPTHHSTIKSGSGSNNNGIGVTAGGAGSGSHGSGLLSGPEETLIHNESAEIVVRDRSGNYEVIVPTLPPMEEEGQGEDEQGGDMEEEDEAREKEKLESRMLELMKQKNLPADEHLAPELLITIQSSLRRKVAGLAEDNWMFEAEKGTDEG